MWIEGGDIYTAEAQLLSRGGSFLSQRSAEVSVEPEKHWSVSYLAGLLLSHDFKWD